jgi:hypothetical protein
MNNNQLKAALEFYNEKAEKLLNLSFTESVSKRKTRLSISATRNSDGILVSTSERKGPPSESIDAFVLTFRFFIQNNEKCSIGKMAELYSSSNIEMNFKEEFLEIRTLTNDFLDTVPDLHIAIDDRLMTRREIVEMVIYGDLSHANDKKRAIHQSWTRSEISRDILNYAFVFILSRLTLPIRALRDLNLRVLAMLN